MPPSRRSSSSHHSSSHRSSSSSRSSSSHHSSHSSHSSSSRYGGYYGSSYSRSHSSSSTTKTRKVPRPARTRVNQPLNYCGTAIRRNHKCVKHDYEYYGQDWTDANSGQYYAKGYYDESGKHYDTLILENNGQYESTFDCQYCGTQTKEVWTEGAAPNCPNCGVNLVESAGEVIYDVVDNSLVEEKYTEPSTGSSTSSNYSVGKDLAEGVAGVAKKGCGCAVLMFISIFVIGIFGVVFEKLGWYTPSDNNDTYVNTDVDVIDDNLGLFGDSIYVESLGRNVDWYDEYESYYDEETDCYFFYNTAEEPAVWQYWYESISSDYGDNGWMEYELDEDQWYIEVGDDDWRKLPSKYDASELWYMTGSLAGTSYTDDYNAEMLGVSIKVDNDSASYLWDNDMISYYVNTHGCYVRVNFDVSPETLQYWYEDISSDYCDDEGYGGWLEYDYGEDCWYVESSRGGWIKVPSSYETSSLWHVEDSITGYTGTMIKAN